VTWIAAGEQRFRLAQIFPRRDRQQAKVVDRADVGRRDAGLQEALSIQRRSGIGMAQHPFETSPLQVTGLVRRKPLRTVHLRVAQRTDRQVHGACEDRGSCRFCQCRLRRWQRRSSQTHC
jgi:hypothetical protein